MYPECELLKVGRRHGGYTQSWHSAHSTNDDPAAPDTLTRRCAGVGRDCGGLAPVSCYGRARTVTGSRDNGGSGERSARCLERDRPRADSYRSHGRGPDIRLRRLGFDIRDPFDSPERRLYLRLRDEHGDAAHSRYNALVRRLVSFERAAECARP